MKKGKRGMAAVLALALCASLTGCTTLGTNTGIYFSEMSDAWSTLVSSMGRSSSTASTGTAEETVSENALGTPGDFTVDESGNYSFTGVENASYYQIFIYDTADQSEYLSVSGQIEETGSGTYTGNIAESLTYGYGDYTVKVIAYPDYSDNDHEKSAAASCEFVNTGTVDEPAVAYYWDCFTGTMGVQLTNINAYEYQSLPTQVEVTFTNEADSADVTTVTIEGVSLEDDIYSAETTELTDGATYSIEVSAMWDETYVDNPEYTGTLDPVTISSEASVITEGYGYLNKDIYSDIDYPAVAENFNLAEGGSMGVWYAFTPYTVSDKGMISYVSFDGTDMNFVATPAETTDGAAYAYTFAIEVVEEGGFGSSKTGTLKIYEDGTFTASVDYVEGVIAAMTTFASDIQGTWSDNGDGTVNLYYDHTSTVLYED